MKMEVMTISRIKQTLPILLQVTARRGNEGSDDGLDMGTRLTVGYGICKVKTLMNLPQQLPTVSLLFSFQYVFDYEFLSLVWWCRFLDACCVGR